MTITRTEALQTAEAANAAFAREAGQEKLGRVFHSDGQTVVARITLRASQKAIREDRSNFAGSAGCPRTGTGG